MRGMTGNFEVHLTGRADDHHRMAEVAAPEGMKLTDIVLDRGRTPAQPMLTFTLKGSWDEVRAQVQDRRHRLAQHGVYAVREKIEADPNNPAVPRTDADAAADPDHRYFEHHLKLRLPDAAPDRLAAITALVTPHQARLSRNARRRDADGEHRFVTQRCHRVGRITARSRLAALRDALAGYEIVEVEEEYVVHDTALHLDDGWLDAPAPPARSAPPPRPGRAGTPPPTCRSSPARPASGSTPSSNRGWPSTSRRRSNRVSRSSTTRSGPPAGSAPAAPPCTVCCTRSPGPSGRRRSCCAAAWRSGPSSATPPANPATSTWSSSRRPWRTTRTCASS
ncbi:MULTISPECIES: hypothetical protein [Catenuloplanes]|uniref:Uncharacterized protein n=1 Tax=Catenuloplanes niger TaxID=587534 RepID=A0AAE4A028_9ACTN|nr:hypothetical protein [Catenuloplanes niger]MDR7327981.1 hypothetical protein [Catenuloplanes niger]